MTATIHEPSTGQPDRRGIASRLLVPEFWAAVSMWRWGWRCSSTAFSGGDMTFGSSTGVTAIPSAVLLALFAVIGMSAVTKRGSGRRGIE